MPNRAATVRDRTVRTTYPSAVRFRSENDIQMWNPADRLAASHADARFFFWNLLRA